MDYFATLLLFVSMYYISEGKRIGFGFGIVACLMWIIFGIQIGVPSIVVVNSVMLTFNVRGLMRKPC
ncbi:MAG TPA: hypothetical protein PLA71_00330 [Saccharofermentans sp.]|nr:hypothetical protein [Saccharofermentans sp.]